jgi:hypothetical protein
MCVTEREDASGRRDFIDRFKDEDKITHCGQTG